VSTLFVAWQDPELRGWFPIGRLGTHDDFYTFVYTRGAERAQVEAAFVPFVSFPDLHTTYVSETLFPLFSNRLLPRSRPEYKSYLNWLGVGETERDPVKILARSGGRKATDTLELFPSPVPNVRGEYEIHFLVHGLNYVPEDSVKRAMFLRPGEPLLAMLDFQNPHDPQAVALRTAEQTERDLHLVGYCPGYLRPEILRLIQLGNVPQISVERVNRAPAPLQFRLLCKAATNWPSGFQPFNEPDFEPLSTAEVQLAEIAKPSWRYRA
jgi:hypothetical protein